MDELITGSGDSLEVNVPVEFMIGPEIFRDPYEAFHGVVGTFKDTGAQEQPFDVITLIEVDGQIDLLLPP